MSLRSIIKFQKTLALAASASNSFEAEAAERAARRLMETHNIDPVQIPNVSLYNRMNFADNAVLKRLRDEWREQHPHYWYGKIGKNGSARRLRRKPRSKPAAKPDELELVNLDGVFDGVFDADAAEPVNTAKPTTKPEPVNFDGMFDDFMRNIAAKSER
jgi:hypothetical protein